MSLLLRHAAEAQGNDRQHTERTQTRIRPLVLVLTYNLHFSVAKPLL